MKNWQKFVIGALGAYFCFKWGSTYQAVKDSKSFMDRTEEEKVNDTMKIPYSRGLDVTVGPGKIEAKFSESENLKEEE